MKIPYSFIYYAKHINEGIDSLPMQTLYLHDITICLSGTMHYVLNNEKVIVNKGDIVYFAPGNVRRRLATPEQTNTFVSINLEGDDAPLLKQNFFQKIVNKKCLDILDEIEQAFTYGDKDTICLLTLLLAQEIQKQQRLTEEDPRILRIKAYVYNHAYEKITVESIATHIGYTSIYCNALFEKHTGKTLIGFVNEVKISIAQNYLKNSSVNLKNLSLKLGFSSYNYFSRCFKKITGTCPKQYVLLVKSTSPPKLSKEK